MIATWRLNAYVWYSENTTSGADKVEYITSPSENTLTTSQTYHIPKTSYVENPHISQQYYRYNTTVQKCSK